MSWTLPGAIGAKLAKPNKKLLDEMGDGGFLMNSQELETAMRYQLPFTVLVWGDKSYGSIKWKMDMELGHHSQVNFDDPDFIKYAQAFGAKTHLITDRSDLVNSIRNALASKNINIIICPVDYSENMKLIQKLGEITISI